MDNALDQSWIVEYYSGVREGEACRSCDFNCYHYDILTAAAVVVSPLLATMADMGVSSHVIYARLSHSYRIKIHLVSVTTRFS